MQFGFFMFDLLKSSQPMNNNIKQYSILLIVLATLVFGCKKDNVTVNNSPQKQSQPTWIKFGNFSINSPLVDFKQTSNGNLGLLENEYILVDSNGIVVQKSTIPQSEFARLWRIAPHAFVNFSGTVIDSTTKQYLISYTFDEQGKMKQSGIVNPKSLITYPDTAYITLIDDQIDKPNSNKAMRFFRIRTQTQTQLFNRYFLSGRDPYTNPNDDSYIEINGNPNHYITTNNAYLFYSDFNSQVAIYNKGFTQTGYEKFPIHASNIKASNQAFFLQYPSGVYSTTNGNDYELLSDNFSMHQVVNDTLLIGLSNNEPSLFNIKSKQIITIGSVGLPADYKSYAGMYKLYMAGNKMYWFGNGGAYVHQLKQ